MRTSLERLMDHFNVPATTIATDRSGKRRFDTVERVWVTVIDMAPLNHLAAIMMRIDFKETAKHAGKPEVHTVQRGPAFSPSRRHTLV
jgi:hypothetical protein